MITPKNPEEIIKELIVRGCVCAEYQYGQYACNCEQEVRQSLASVICFAAEQGYPVGVALENSKDDGTVKIRTLTSEEEKIVNGYRKYLLALAERIEKGE